MAQIDKLLDIELGEAKLFFNAWEGAHFPDHIFFGEGFTGCRGVNLEDWSNEKFATNDLEQF